MIPRAPLRSALGYHSAALQALSNSRLCRRREAPPRQENPLSVAALKSLRDEHARTIDPARAQAAEALTSNAQLAAGLLSLGPSGTEKARRSAIPPPDAAFPRRLCESPCFPTPDSANR